MSSQVGEFDNEMAQVKKYMKKMQEQMDDIRQTQEPQEWQKLSQDHQVTMQKKMKFMHDNWWPGSGMGCCVGSVAADRCMMGGRMLGWRDMGGNYPRLSAERMKQRRHVLRVFRAHGDDADGYLPVFLRVRRLGRRAQTDAWRLVRLLFPWIDQVSFETKRR